MIAALKRERATYVARGLDDRVAEVDKQLKHYGHEPAAESTDENGAPKGRTTPEGAKQTTAEGSKQTAEAPKQTAAKPEAAKPSTAAKPSPQTAAQKRAGGKD